VALLANTGAAVAVLATLIALLGPIRGAHLNPAVSLIQALRKASPGGTPVPAAIQVLGCCLGVILAHACSVFRGCSRPFMFARVLPSA
jgi:glycerol uptake facilitator-like aquaporin